MLIDRSQQVTCRARPPRKLQLVLLSTLCVTSSLARTRFTGSCSTVALQIPRRPVACAGGAQMHRLLLLCTKRHTSWAAFGDDHRSVHLCSTAVHLASPSKMPAEQRRVCSRQGNWHRQCVYYFATLPQCWLAIFACGACSYAMASSILSGSAFCHQRACLPSNR